MREDAVQLGHDHAVFIRGDLDELAFVLLEGVDGAQIAGALDHDHVARIQVELAQKVQALLAAGGEEHVVGVGVDVVAGRQTLDDVLAQGLPALGGAILQRDAAVFIHDGVQRGLEILHREQLRRGQAVGKGDDARLADDL